MKTDESNPELWTARRARDAMAGGEISARDYARAHFDACQRNDDLNAFVALEEDWIMRCAAAADTVSDPGLLHGLPIALKDAIGTAGLPTTSGTPSLKNHLPTKDAEVVSPLTAAGAYVFGKLNMHELSYGITSNNGHSGPVRNPYDKNRIAGGSSGGAAAAVAARLVPIALGTDTGGSVRIPAALCGVVGFRPSIGRYPQGGIIPVSQTRDTAGPIARCVDDAAMIDAAITGEPDHLEARPSSQIRLGLPNQYFLDVLATDIRDVFESRLDALRAAGWTIEPVDLEGIEEPADGCGFPIATYETKQGLLDYLHTHAPHGPTLDEVVAQIGSPDVRAILDGLLRPEFDELERVYRHAMEVRRPALQRRLANCFDQHRVDALIFPTTVLPASPIGDDETTDLNGAPVPVFPTFIHNTDPGSIAGIPGISVPAGLTESGLPVGIELDGPFNSDRNLLAVARQLENALPATPGPNQ